MPRDATLSYRREQLATDASAIGTIADRLQSLLDGLRFEAAMMSDGATGEAMVPREISPDDGAFDFGGDAA